LFSASWLFGCHVRCALNGSDYANKILLVGLYDSSSSASLIFERTRFCMSLTDVMAHACSPVGDRRRLTVTSLVYQPSLWCLYNTHETSNGLQYMLRNILNTQIWHLFLNLSFGWVRTFYIMTIHNQIHLLEKLNSTQNF